MSFEEKEPARLAKKAEQEETSACPITMIDSQIFHPYNKTIVSNQKKKVCEMKDCFFITPFGEENSTIQNNAMYLQRGILEPVMKEFGFTVRTGQYLSGLAYIGSAVAEFIRNADLCIADVSFQRIEKDGKSYTNASPNVFYEIGLREALGKPIIFLRHKDAEPMPTDIIGKYEVNYDSNIESYVKTREDLRHAVEAVLDQGPQREQELRRKDVTIDEISEQLKNVVDKSFRSGPISDLTDFLQRVGRKLDLLIYKQFDTAPAADDAVDTSSLIALCQSAVFHKDIPAAECYMELLRSRMDKLTWLDRIVEITASNGSRTAGDILIDNAQEVLETADSFTKKIDYLGCLVSNLNKTDREAEYIELVEWICDLLRADSSDADPEDQIQINNQLNRLYYGMYVATDDKKWLDKAISELEQALSYLDKNYLHYNLAICLRDRKHGNDEKEAMRHAVFSVDMSGSDIDPDHLVLVCQMLHDANDPRLPDYLEMLTQINEMKSIALQKTWEP